MKIVVRGYSDASNGLIGGKSDADVLVYDAGIVNADGLDRHGWSFVNARVPNVEAGYLVETRNGNESSAKIFDRALLGNIYLSAPEYTDIASYYLGREDEEASKYTDGLDSLMMEDDRKRLLIMRSYFLHHLSIRQACTFSGEMGDFISNEIFLLFSHHNEEEEHRRLQIRAIDKIEEVKSKLLSSGYKHRLSVFMTDTSRFYSIVPGYNLTSLTKYQLPVAGCFSAYYIYDNPVRYFVGHETYRLPNEKHVIGNWPNYGITQLGDKSTQIVGYQRQDDHLMVADGIPLMAYLKWLRIGTLDKVELNGAVYDMTIFKHPI